MKCQYCGGNLGLESEVCPFCGRENPKSEKYVRTKKSYQKAFDETEKKVKKQVKINARTGRLLFIALMVVIVLVMVVIERQYDDAATRIRNRQQKTERLVDKNINDIAAALKEMEKNREYLKMSYYILNYSLYGRREFEDYNRVFSATNAYNTIFEDILNITTGFDFYGENEVIDWCNSIAQSVTTWKRYVEGEFWGDKADSPMYAGEHGAFMTDCKTAVRDMVQVYFKLSDEQAEAMWSMEKEEFGQLLYDQYKSIYPEVSANE